MKPIEKTNRWFSFKGVKNTDMHVAMMSMPVRPLPAALGELKAVPGMNGKMWLPENAYDRVLVSLSLYTLDDANIDAVCAWLSGEGNLVFGDEPDKCYHARITKQFNRSNHNARFANQDLSPSFDCEPFRYQATPVSPISVTTTGTKITNPGTIASAPLLKVSGSGNGTLMIGGATMLLDNLSAPVYVDCDAKFAYAGEGTTASPRVLATQHVTGDWIRIAPGDNYVSFTGGVTGVTITPRWRWL